MYDVVTFGSATLDIFLKSGKFRPVSDEKFTTGKGICLNLGSKIEMEGAFFSTGGGGTNSAATFSKQGMKTAYCGKIGKDYFGSLVMKELKFLKVETSFIKETEEKPTNVSVVLTDTGEDKTILVYRGASDILNKKDISWDKLKKTKWFYLAPFSGGLADITEDLVNFAHDNNIKVALNPGYSQLNFPKDKLQRIFKKIDILILNQEEASLLAGIPYQEEKEIFKLLDNMVSGVCIMTKGKDGVVVSDGKNIYNAPSLQEKEIIDSTGAGDSFGSGFVSDFIKTGDIVSSIQLGVANAVSNIRLIGAKGGLLEKNEQFEKVQVLFEKI